MLFRSSDADQAPLIRIISEYLRSLNFLCHISSVFPTHKYNTSVVQNKINNNPETCGLDFTVVKHS